MHKAVKEQFNINLLAPADAQLKYVKSVLKLCETFNCSGPVLKGGEDGVLTLFRDAMVQLQECAEHGRDMAVRRRMAKKQASKSRIYVDGGNNSDSESVDSNITTTTTGSSPERKKQKKSDGD